MESTLEEKRATLPAGSLRQRCAGHDRPVHVTVVYRFGGGMETGKQPWECNNWVTTQISFDLATPLRATMGG